MRDLHKKIQHHKLNLANQLIDVGPDRAQEWRDQILRGA